MKVKVRIYRRFIRDRYTGHFAKAFYGHYKLPYTLLWKKPYKYEDGSLDSCFATEEEVIKWVKGKVRTYLLKHTSSELIKEIIIDVEL